MGEWENSTIRQFDNSTMEDWENLIIRQFKEWKIETLIAIGGINGKLQASLCSMRSALCLIVF
jgi:hypothetical protein